MMSANNQESQHFIGINTKSVNFNSCGKPIISKGDVPTPNYGTSNKEDTQDEPDTEKSNTADGIKKDYILCMYKPLIPLKMVLFCWFGAGAVIVPYIPVYFKQRGLTLTELSSTYTIAPPLQFLGTTLSGIIADKLGRSKPVLVGNLVITMLAIISLLMMPGMNIESCDGQPFFLECDERESNKLIAKTTCGKEKNITVKSCNVGCPKNSTQYCYGDSLMCRILQDEEEFHNFSLSLHMSSGAKLKNECSYNVNTLIYNYTAYSWCQGPHKMKCVILCEVFTDEKCTRDKASRWELVVANMVIYIIFLMGYTTCFRILDVTSMSLVKEHNSSFGRERFFSILSTLIFSSLSGYIIDLSTPTASENNYASTFYCFIGLTLLTLAITYKLKVKIEPPGENMWKKSLILMRNTDIIIFILVLFVLGTTWNFTKNFTNWFLEDLNAPAILMGLIPAMNSLYGLPFLLTSNWWVKKIGASNIFIIALVAYCGNTVGYSFLINPWFTLLLEVSAVFTYHLLWVAVIVHSHEIAPEGLTATVISVAGAIHYSVGKASSSLIGGLIMSAFGGRLAYRVIALICLIAAILYALYVYIRRRCLSVTHNFENNCGIENSGYKEESRETYTQDPEISYVKN